MRVEGKLWVKDVTCLCLTASLHLVLGDWSSKGLIESLAIRGYLESY